MSNQTEPETYRIPPNPKPSWQEIREVALQLALEDDPKLPRHIRDHFFYPEHASPPTGEMGDYWRNIIKGHWHQEAKRILKNGGLLEKDASPRKQPKPPEPEPDPEPRVYYVSMDEVFTAKREQKVKPLPQKRHDRYAPVRTPTLEEVRKKALKMALEDDPKLPKHVRELFFYPEWVGPPPGELGQYWAYIVRGHWYVVARDALQTEYNAQPRIKLRKRKKPRPRPNRYRSWTRLRLKNGPPQPRRRVFRLPQLCSQPAAPPPLIPTRPGAPPGRPREDITPAILRPRRETGHCTLALRDGRADWIPQASFL